MAINEQAKNDILNYADEIETLSSFIEHVRLRPGMYIGPIGNDGFINMIREIIQNCFDEIFKGKAVSKLVLVEYDEKTKRVTISDNGRGIPFNNIVRIFSQERTSSNYHAKDGVFKSGMNGMGSKIVNALSKVFIVESFILGKGKRVEFYDGIPWDKGNSYNEEEIKNPDIQQGTRVTFIPSEVMEKESVITTTWQDIFYLIDLLLPLTVIGTEVHFVATDLKGVVHQEHLKNEDGLLKYIINMSSKPILAPIMISNVSPQMKVDLIISFDSEDIQEQILSFGNYCPTTSGGTHVDGLKLGIQEYFRNYMNKVFLANNKKKLTVINADISNGLKAVVSAAHIEPVFTGQAKEYLSNIEIKNFVKTSVIKGLEDWSKNNSKDLQKLCQFFKDIAEIRTKTDKEKVKLTDKFAKSVIGLPRKFRDCTGTKEDGLELFIVEGDSAGGAAINARIDKTQAIFPIRGKIISAFSNSKEKVLSNEEAAGIITICGCGYGKACDPSKSRFEKIIFMADADADGKHISKLLLSLFLLYMLPMIEAGKVYKAVPPLYAIPKGKNGMKYFTDKTDYIKHVLSIFNARYNMTFLDGSNISNQKAIDILYKNMEYVYELETFSNNLGINPELVEFVLINRNNTFSNLQKIIKKKYRFFNVEKYNNAIKISGLLDNKMETLYLNNTFVNNAKSITNYMDVVNKNMNYLMINNVPTSMYNVVNLFNKTSPDKLYRYKGLGEMTQEQLFDSTMDPNKRTLIQYTVNNAKEELEQIRYYENNMNELLIGLDNLSRSDILG